MMITDTTAALDLQPLDFDANARVFAYVDRLLDEDLDDRRAAMCPGVIGILGGIAFGPEFLWSEDDRERARLFFAR